VATPSAPGRSVDLLERLYAVIIGLALTEGLKNAVLSANTALPQSSIFEKTFRPETWPILALLFTIIPFFHGANRHLDDVYVFRRSSAKDFALVLDFLFLFSEGTVFYWMALVTSDASYFFRIYVFLLALDIAWGCAVFFYTENGWQGVKKWVVINLVTVALAGILIATPLLGQIARIHALGLLALARSAFDYVFQWKFYYPPEDSSMAVGA
jgi:hypothetical protein